MANEGAEAVILERLNKQYKRGDGSLIRPVQDLDLRIPQGQVFGFLGANGAGKTTTIKMICGLVLPDSGKVTVMGVDCSRHRRKVLRDIGVVLEGTRNIYWRLSPWDNLMYFGRLKGLWGKPLKRRAERLLRDLDLWKWQKEPVRVFSRGMQQKVAVACALVADPSLILLDEPTLGLDVHTTRVVKSWIADLSASHGKTVLLTTHQLRDAQELCDHIAIMKQGRLIANHKVPDLLGLFNVDHWRVRLKGRLAETRPEWMQGLEVSEEEGETLISGSLTAQQSIYEALEKIKALGLPLISLNKVKPSLEEVYVRLIDAE